jgi:hypothetical protein
MKCNIRLKTRVIHLKSGGIHVKAGTDGRTAIVFPEMISIFKS